MCVPGDQRFEKSDARGAEKTVSVFRRCRKNSRPHLDMPFDCSLALSLRTHDRESRAAGVALAMVRGICLVVLAVVVALKEHDGFPSLL